MTGITLRRGLDMVRGLARGLYPVMAVGAGSGYIVMIECGWHPGTGRMTAVTLARGLYMITRLPGSLGSVMATATGTGYARVIKGRSLPGMCCMATITLPGGSNMSAMLASCRRSIVTGAAGSHYRAMIYTGNPVKHHGVMTGFAIIQGVNVARTLSFGRYVVMTGLATPHHTSVIKTCRYHGNRRMTVITGNTTLDMISRFTDRNRTVMTAKTIPRGSLEQALAVAARTFHDLMRTGQDITRSEVIKFCALREYLRVRKHQESHQNHYKTRGSYHFYHSP